MASNRTTGTVYTIPCRPLQVGDVVMYLAGKKLGASRAMVLKVLLNSANACFARDIGLHPGKEDYIHTGKILGLAENQSVETSEIALGVYLDTAGGSLDAVIPTIQTAVAPVAEVAPVVEQVVEQTVAPVVETAPAVEQAAEQTVEVLDVYVPLAEILAVKGITKDALRKRVGRGSILTRKVGDVTEYRVN